MNIHPTTRPSTIQDDASSSTGTDITSHAGANPSTLPDAVTTHGASANKATDPGTELAGTLAERVRAKKANAALARPELLALFEASPPWARFTEKETAEILRYSPAKLQRDRWAGTGLPFVREDGSIFYLQGTIASRVKEPTLHTSTAAADASPMSRHSRADIIDASGRALRPAGVEPPDAICPDSESLTRCDVEGRADHEATRLGRKRCIKPEGRSRVRAAQGRAG